MLHDEKEGKFLAKTNILYWKYISGMLSSSLMSNFSGRQEHGYNLFWLQIVQGLWCDRTGIQYSLGESKIIPGVD